MPSICIFACDHHRDVKWNLPYIRFGGPESDCAINTNANCVYGRDIGVDETSKLFWLYNNIDQFGCDIIGYHQYRRFFTKVACNSPLVNISENNFKREYAMTPLEQACLIQQNNADGILHPPFNFLAYKTNNIWEQTIAFSGEGNFPSHFHKKIFDIFLDNSPNWLQPYIEQSFTISENYLCNIFTAKTNIFKMFGDIAFKSILQVHDLIDDEQRKKLHPYHLAFFMERYTNCFFHALELSSKFKFIKVPLMTIDGQKHVDFSKQSKKT